MATLRRSLTDRGLGLNPTVRFGGVRRHALAFLGFTAMTAAFFWPIVRHFPTRVLFAGDGNAIVWSYWAMPRAALRGDNPFLTTDIYFPVGANLAVHATTPAQQLLTWPAQHLFGLGAASNLMELSATLLSAVGAYMLALYVCGDRRAAFVAGVAFAFVPYRFVHAGGHFNLIHTEFLPVGLLALFRFLDAPSRARALGVGVVVGLTFLTDAYLTAFLLLGMIVICVYRREDAFSSSARLHLLTAGGTAGIVALPLLVPMVGAMMSGELDPLPGWGGADKYSVDFLSWFLPAGNHPFWGSLVSDARRSLPARGEGLAYPGLTVLVLAVAGREFGKPAARRVWVAVAWIMAVLAMGPFLQLGSRSGRLFSYLGRDFLVPLPYMLIHFVPVLSGLRVPGRFAIMTALALDVLAALALTSISRRKPRWAWPVMAAALILVTLEFLPGSLASRVPEVPRPYHRIRSDPNRGAVLEVPLQWASAAAVLGDRAADREHTVFMYYATVHEKPLVSGYVSRYPSRRLRELTSVPVYRQMLALGDEPGFLDPPSFRSDDLRRLGIGFVVYHRDRPQPRAFEYLKGLGLTTLDDDGTVVVWRVDP